MRRLGKRLIYVLLAVAAFFIVKAKFLTPPEVMVAPVKRQDLIAEVQGTGTVAVDVLANVGAKIPGRLQKVLVNERDFVRNGQIIATLEDTDIRRELQRTQARLEAARATEWQARRAWEREKHLVATGAVSQEEADQYEERYRTAQSAVAAAEADVRFQEFNLSETRIFTYVSGIVVNRPKRPGDAIVPGETVATIADPNLTMVDAFFDQRFSGQIHAGQSAALVLRGRENEAFRGRVYRLRPQADPAAEEMTVEVSFPLSPKELEIGQWADAYVQVGEAKDALVVPKPAVMPMGKEHVVLVAGADHKVRQVKVEVLASSPRLPLLAVKGDLKVGEQVLIKPMGIRPGQKVRLAQSSAPGAVAATTQ